MPRNNDPAGKMSAGAGGGSSNSDRFQPGRVMLVLRDALVDDELVYQIALQAGEVKNVHRPQHNRQLVFVQYEDPIVAEHAIAMMKKLPIFKGVDPAIKSERFVKDKSDVGGGSGGNNNNNSNYNDDQQQRSSSSMNNQMNKGGGNRQQKPGNNANNNKNINNRMNNNNNSGMNGYGDVNLMTMDFETSQRPQSRTTDMYQPKFNLGCWSCTKMPYFECRCGAFYCNVECQRADWPIHKDVCMPRLVPISSSSNRILQEALSASLQRSGVDSQSHYQQQQQQQQYQQQERQPQQNQQQKQQKQSQQQQNQNNRRGQTNNSSNNKDFQSPVDQQQNQGKPKKDSTRTPGQEPEAQRQPPKQQKQSTTPKSSPEEQNSAGSAEKVSRLGNKLQRLKIAKSGGGVTRGILQAGPFPREGAAVKITASLPSGVLYIYHNNGKDGQQSEYYLLTNRMFKAANDAGALKAVPTVDDVIFAPFLGGYYRAKVLAVNGEKLQVFYVDFGNTDTVEWKQSREIADEDLKWARYLTYPVKLEGVESFSGEMLKLLETLEHVEEFEMVRADSMPGSEMKSVILKRPKQSLTLNMELMEVKERELRERKEREQKSKQQQQQQSSSSGEQSSSSSAQKAKVADVKIADPSNYEPVLFDESMETSPLPFGSTKKLIIIDASEVMETRIISVVAAENVEKYAAVLEHCGMAGAKDSNVYKPIEEGEVCLVLHQEDWSRALYDISDGSYMLLDVGIIATVPAGNVRRFPPKLSHMVYNNEVVVENLPKLKAMMKDGKSDTVHGAIIEAKVSASEEGTSITIVDALVSP